MFGTKQELVARIEVLTGLSLVELGSAMLAGGFDIEYDMRTATGFSVGRVTLYPARNKGWRVACACGAEFIRIFNDIK